MRVLLDECLPKKLKRLLSGHEVWTVVAKGWSGKRNGDLLTLAQTEFDALLTVDRNLRFQQRVARFEMGVIVLAVSRNTLEELQPLVPAVLQALETLENGQVVELGG